MVETKSLSEIYYDRQTQFGNARQLDPSDSIFVFRDTLSDYEEPPSDNEVSTFCPFISWCIIYLYSIDQRFIFNTGQTSRLK